MIDYFEIAARHREGATPSAAQKTPKKKRKLPATKVQSIVISKKVMNKAQAVEWVKSHGFRAKKIDETEGAYHFRQRPPGAFRKDTFRTIPFRPGVQARIGHPLTTVKKGGRLQGAQSQATSRRPAPQARTKETPMAKKKTPPRYKSGPKKGQFKPKGARKAPRSRKAGEEAKRRKGGGKKGRESAETRARKAAARKAAKTRASKEEAKKRAAAKRKRVREEEASRRSRAARKAAKTRASNEAKRKKKKKGAKESPLYRNKKGRFSKTGKTKAGNVYAVYRNKAGKFSKTGKTPAGNVYEEATSGWTTAKVIFGGGASLLIGYGVDDFFATHANKDASATGDQPPTGEIYNVDAQTAPIWTDWKRAVAAVVLGPVPILLTTIPMMPMKGALRIFGAGNLLYSGPKTIIDLVAKFTGKTAFGERFLAHQIMAQNGVMNAKATADKGLALAPGKVHVLQDAGQADPNGVKLQGARMLKGGCCSNCANGTGPCDKTKKKEPPPPPAPPPMGNVPERQRTQVAPQPQRQEAPAHNPAAPRKWSEPAYWHEDAAQ